MTSVLAYPMPDPFATSSRAPADAAAAAAAARHPSFAPQPAQLAPPAPTTSASPAANFVLPPARSYSASATEFGAYAAAASGSASAPGTRTARPSPSPGVAAPLPVPDVPGTSSYAQAQAARKRQSHNPSATLQLDPSPPRPEMLTEEYVLHPSVWAFKDAHPRRPMVGFGPYVLLQTLGEGEFGKVKLGVHNEYGVETAIKLIRRGSLDDEVRASKVEREIDVLKSLKHPNIVRMFDVIDTEKYIGIVLEFAGGGELFDHILANRYLKEKDAARLFAQLISGVDYLHKKHIIHRDLKLENLLLDKHRNIVITDFGFANRFDHEADDLMATSCGSPCYAAPELVVSEGLYVGSAVDIWSCGVILYAMLSGYLPYDDDPDNPDGNNINLLYRYIMNTRLKFPDHVSPEAIHLLQIMMVPNPEYRCTVRQIMEHPWLEAHRDLFSRSVEEHEYMFAESMYRKSQQAKRELQARREYKNYHLYGQARAPQRSQSSAPGSAVTAAMLDKQRRQQRHQSAMPATTTMPNIAGRTAYESTTTTATSTPGASTPVALPATPLAAHLDLVSPAITESTVTSTPLAISTPAMPAAPSIPSPLPASAPVMPTPPTPAEASVPMAVEPIKGEATAGDEGQAQSKPRLSANTNRHTIQVEYDGEASYERMSAALDAQVGRPPAAAEVSTAPVTAPVPPTRGPVLDSVLTLGEAASAYHSKDSTAELTPVTPTAPVAEALASPPAVGSAAPAAPATPSKRVREPLDDVASPATPKASARIRDEITTPRAEVTPRPVLRPTEPPQPVVAAARPAAAADAKRASAPAKGRAPPPAAAAAAPKPFPSLPPPPSAQQAKRRSRKGMSLDKFGLARILGQASAAQDEAKRSAASTPQPPPSAGASAAAVQLQQQQQQDAAASVSRGKRGSLGPSTVDSRKDRRKTLQLMTRLATPTTSVTPATATDTSRQQRQPSPPIVVSTHGLAPAPVERGQSSPSLVTANAYQPGSARDAPTPTPDQPRRGHKHSASVSSNAAKKVMDWFRRKSLARDAGLTGLRQPGVRADSTSSFVRVSVSPAPGGQPADARDGRALVETTPLGAADQAASAANSVAHYAMSSTSSIGHTQEAEVTPSVPAKTSSLAVPGQARQPLAPAGSKANMDLHSTPDLTLSPHDAQAALPQRSKSHRPSPSPSPSVSAALAPSVSVQQPARAPRGSVSGGKLAAGAVSTSRAEDKIRFFPGGPVTQAALTTRPPADVMADVVAVLQAMGIDIKRETEWRLRCTRARRRKAGAGGGVGTGLGLGSVMSGSGSVGGFSLMGSASMSRTDSRGLPASPSAQSGLLSGSGLKGMLLRRGSSHSTGLASPTPSTPGLLASPAAPAAALAPLYGEHSIDNGDEVKFIVELCKMRNLSNLYHLNIRRLRGSVWSFKFIYETTLDRCQTLTH